MLVLVRGAVPPKRKWVTPSEIHTPLWKILEKNPSDREICYLKGSQLAKYDKLFKDQYLAK